VAHREAGDGRHRDSGARRRRIRTVGASAAGVITIAAAASIFVWQGTTGHGFAVNISGGSHDVASGPNTPGETLVTTAPAEVSVTTGPSVRGSSLGPRTPTPGRTPGQVRTTGTPAGEASTPALAPMGALSTTTRAATTSPPTRRAPTSPPSKPPTSPVPPTPSTPATTPAPSGDMTALEQQVVDLTNAARATAGCAPLTANPALVAAAHDHVDDMVAGQYFAHTSPSGVTPQDRATKFGFTGGVGENIEAGSATASAAFETWYGEGPSGGHYQNIVNCSYKYVGVGFNAGAVQPYSGGVWAEVFG
jgi:uncharacterized protein YkwD